MDKGVTFIHTADLHLDSPFSGLSEMPGQVFEEVKRSTFQALERLVTLAITERVDFVLLTGDLFDNEKQSLRAQVQLRQAFEQLKEYEIQVYLSYGNHDYVTGNIHQVTYPDNVHIFPDEQVRSFLYEKNGEPLAKVYGFSYVERVVMENKTSEYIIADEDIPFHIAMLHGSLHGTEGHDPYAPFQLSELITKNFDYWALGHIHQRAVLTENPPVIYPGNIQGRHRKEAGEKGCYLVQLKKTATEFTFVPLHAIEFSSMELDVSHCEQIFQLEKELISAIEQKLLTTPSLIDLALTSNRSELIQWQAEGELAEIIEIVNESLLKHQPWQYVYQATINYEDKTAMEQVSYGEHFLGELEASFQSAELEPFLKELFQHRQARKYVAKPEEVKLAAWKKQARGRLFNKLLRGGSR